MKITLKLTLLILATLLVSSSFAKNRNNYKHINKKEINKQFTVASNVEIDIDNIFGDIVIVEGNRNEVTIDVIITIKANKLRTFEKMTDEIEVDISKSGNRIIAVTSVGSNKKDGNKNTNKTSKDRSISVDYRITAPKDYIPTIKNQFGKIKLDEVVADADIEVEFGTLNIKKANKLELHAEFSKVRIEEIVELDIDKFAFGRLDITKLNRSIDCDDIEFSKLKIEDCSEELERIDIEGEFTPITVTIPETVIIKTRLESEFGRITNKHSGSMKGSKFDAEVNIETAFANIRILRK